MKQHCDISLPSLSRRSIRFQSCLDRERGRQEKDPLRVSKWNIVKSFCLLQSSPFLNEETVVLYYLHYSLFPINYFCLISSSRPVFRSYRPLDENLKDGELPDAAPGEVTDKVREELEKEDEGVQIDKLVSHDRTRSHTCSVKAALKNKNRSSLLAFPTRTSPTWLRGSLTGT